ncbi:lipid kinase YegS [Bradymonadaceae bacterium TMQ3]|nr:lipid kinase YegS [Bradymonadaceae bacterium TMQ3]TXC68638.1 YegS/Rv2252/BmrU family lipid kinase [Bradymonadales bacterium TMQ1]
MRFAMIQKEAAIYMVLNPSSAADDALRELVGELRQKGYRVCPRCREEGDGARAVREAAEDGAELVVACGGDGTLHEVANALMALDEAQRPAMAGLPYGTGNDFLGALGVDPKESPAQLAGWLDEETWPVDVGRINDRHFINMATAGAGATVTAETSRGFKDVAGSLAYFVKAIPAAFDLPVHHLNARAPGLEWEGEAAFIFVGNGPQSGGGWSFCPAARVDDGLLDLVIVPAMGLSEMVRQMRELVSQPEATDCHDIVYRRVKEAHLRFEEEVPLNLDGESFPGREFAFSVRPGALAFLGPRPPRVTAEEEQGDEG